MKLRQKPVVVTEPHPVVRRDDTTVQSLAPATRRSTLQRGVIHGVPLESEIDEIIASTGAKWARSIKSSKTVVITFEATNPDQVRVGRRNFTVRPYIAQPLRYERS